MAMLKEIHNLSLTYELFQIIQNSLTW